MKVLPKFIKESFRIDKFLMSLEQLLNAFSSHLFNQTFIHNISSAKFYSKHCLDAYKVLYQTIFECLPEQDEAFKTESQHYTTTRDATKKLDYDKIIYGIGSYLTTRKRNLSYYEQRFIHNLISVMKNSIICLIDSLDKCKYFYFAIDDCLSENSAGQTLQVPSMKILEFMTLKNLIFENINDAFNDIMDIPCISFTSTLDQTMLMPGVFYEYFIHNNIEILPNQKFHADTSKTITDKMIFNNIKGENVEISVINEIKDEITHFYFVPNENRYEIFPRFEFSFLNDNEETYSISSLDNTQNIAYFHPKTTDNAQNGFWVTFSHSKLRLYFKELFCTSERFEMEHQGIFLTYKNPSVYDYGFTERRIKRELIQNNMSKVDDSEAVLLSRINVCRSMLTNSFAQIPYHINEYVELSGYFLLEMLQMIPKLNAFFSEFYERPMIVVEGVDLDKYNMVSSIDQKNVVNRYNFNYIINDANALFMSSIPIQKLRIIQSVFLIDDFHEGNLAISISKDSYVDPQTQESFYIEYIKDIIVLDIRPARQILKATELLKFENRVNFENCSFSQIILSRYEQLLDPNLRVVYLPINEKEINEEDSETEAMIEYLIARSESLLTLTEEMKIQLYGRRIRNLAQSGYVSGVKSFIVTFYALIDIFDQVYFSNIPMFNSIISFQTNICANIALIILKATYNKCTQETKALIDLFEINQEINHDSVSSDEYNFWIKYLSHVSETIKTIFIQFKHQHILGSIDDPYKYQHIKLVTLCDNSDEVMGKSYSLHKATDCTIERMIFNRMLGFAFSNEIPTNDNFISIISKLFGLNGDDPNSEHKIIMDLAFNKARSKKVPIFYIITSPVIYDFIKSKLDDNYRLMKNDGKNTFKNIYIKTHKNAFD